MTPIVWVAVGGVVASGLAFGAGMSVGEDREYAKRAREDAIVAGVADTAQKEAAAAIAKIRPRNVTIRQESEREIQTRVEYRTCVHSAEQLQRINEAITGRPELAGAGKLPGPGPAQ